MSTNKDFEDVFSEGAEPPKPNAAEELREQRLQRESETMNEFSAEFLRDEQPATTEADKPAPTDASAAAETK